MSSYTSTNTGRMRVIAATLVSASDGTASVTIPATIVEAMRINRVSVVIEVGGSTTPTTLWDLTVKDADGVDILGAGGGNLAVTGQVSLQPKLDASPVVAEGGYFLVSGAITVGATNMGDTKTATVKIYGETVR